MDRNGEDVTKKVKLSSDMGRVRSIIERNNLRKINEKAVEKSDLECDKIMIAGEIAKRRVIEGLEVNQASFNQQVLLKDTIKDEIIGDTGGNAIKERNQEHVEGYQVSEYSIKDYCFITSSAGKTREYKSIYD